MNYLNTDGYIFTFGKYRDETFDDVLEKDASYILWCDDNIKWFNLRKEDRMVVTEYYEEQKLNNSRDYNDYDYLDHDYYDNWSS